MDGLRKSECERSSEGHVQEDINCKFFHYVGGLSDGGTTCLSTHVVPIRMIRQKKDKTGRMYLETIIHTVMIPNSCKSRRVS